MKPVIFMGRFLLILSPLKCHVGQKTVLQINKVIKWYCNKIVFEIQGLNQDLNQHLSQQFVYDWEEEIAELSR